MTIEKIVNEIYSYAFFGEKYDLLNITELCEKLGNPEKKYKIIHVTGTNGKGSTTTTIESFLLGANYKVAKFTSPHILKINERFSVNGKNISDEDLIRVYLKVKEIIPTLQRIPTFFEVITAMMFLFAEEQKVEYLILEVGIGGRLDATNVAEADIAVITNISYDHSEHLGNTLEQIAVEKVGIVKEKSVVVIGEKSPALQKALENKKNQIIFAENYNKNSSFTLDFEKFKTLININNKIFEFSLFGEHQYKNFLTAYTVAKILEISDEIISKVCSEIKWQCRFEIFEEDKNKVVILDGAHNIDGINVLKKTIQKGYSKDEVVALVSILQDKNIKEMATSIEEFAGKIILTGITNNKRGLSGEKLKSFFSENDKLVVEEDLEKAYILAKKQEKEKIIIVCGSFYLLSNLKEITQK